MSFPNGALPPGYLLKMFATVPPEPLSSTSPAKIDLQSREQRTAHPEFIPNHLTPPGTLLNSISGAPQPGGHGLQSRERSSAAFTDSQPNRGSDGLHQFESLQVHLDNLRLMDHGCILTLRGLTQMAADTAVEELCQHFQRFGKVKQILLTQKRGKRGSLVQKLDNLGFVVMNSVAEALLALQYPVHQQIGGVQVKVGKFEHKSYQDETGPPTVAPSGRTSNDKMFDFPSMSAQRPTPNNAATSPQLRREAAAIAEAQQQQAAAMAEVQVQQQLQALAANHELAGTQSFEHLILYAQAKLLQQRLAAAHSTLLNSASAQIPQRGMSCGLQPGLVSPGAGAAQNQTASFLRNQNRHSQAPSSPTTSFDMSRQSTTSTRMVTDHSSELSRSDQSSRQSTPQVPQNTKLRQQLEQLQEQDPACIFAVRKIARMGFDSGEILEEHFSRYGEVLKVMVPYSSIHDKHVSQIRWRPGGLGFVLMASAESVKRILAAGTEQVVAGHKVAVGPYMPNCASTTSPSTTTMKDSSSSLVSMDQSSQGSNGSGSACGSREKIGEATEVTTSSEASPGQ